MMNDENGRSMVEMLGVLAIIGVLSVAGIAGYSMAMKKYRTNEILNAASQLVVLAQAKYVANPSANGTAETSELGGSGYKVAGYTMQASCGSSGCTVTRLTPTTGGDDWAAAVTQAGTTYYTIAS